MKYAKVIIDISAEAVNRAFTYSIPEDLESEITVGTRVKVPFGNADRTREGFVIEVTPFSGFDEARIKPLKGKSDQKQGVNGELIRLAGLMAEECGCTMNQALTTVLPIKREIRNNSRRKDPVKAIEELDGISRDEETLLNPDQRRVYEEILAEKKVSLLHGITGSGKTRVYIELIKHMISLGKATIVLIPEISLTYQTVAALIRYLGDGVAVMHSRLSEGEKYEQYKKAESGETLVMVGARSAVFTPFSNLGLIIIDEEHEMTYRSENTPKYDARWVAEKRAAYFGAKLVLGSATPSLKSYTLARQGVYALHTLTHRAHDGAVLPDIHIADMRTELAAGNRSMFSRKLHALIEDRLDKKEQIMLFLNRRGYANFVSCRSCGKVLKCPNCDVSLTAHNSWYIDRRTGAASALLCCHYCGYTAPMPKICPDCGSKYIAPFGTGTEKLEQLVKKTFPNARVLRMDADTTAQKGGHERVLSSFKKKEADILIGTQMIVKGHDFPDVTLVGIVAADMSINASEYDASENTYQLITQASGRSGRGGKKGDVVIQSYAPSHYAISCAAMQDYESFYEREMSYRRLLNYPPVTYMLFFRMRSKDEELLNEAAQYGSELAKRLAMSVKGISTIGPCEESIYKINNTYRKILYIKHARHDIIIKIRNELTKSMSERFPASRLQLGSEIR